MKKTDFPALSADCANLKSAQTGKQLTQWHSPY